MTHRIKIFKKLLLPLSILLLVSGCQHLPEEEASAVSLGDYSWVLVELGGNPISAAQVRKNPYLIFIEAEQRISGFTGCNRLMGSYDLLEDGTLILGKVATTKRACPAMATEGAFLQALGSFSKVRLSKDSLILLDVSGVALARLDAQLLP